jgi:trk system potassium uptake protein TrkH
MAVYHAAEQSDRAFRVGLGHDCRSGFHSFSAGSFQLFRRLFEAIMRMDDHRLSVIDVSLTPHIFLFHRSFMQFCGGLGFVMVMIMLIQDKQSMNLYNAEGHPDKLMPNLKKTAQMICLMYNSFLIAGTAAYGLRECVYLTLCCIRCARYLTGGFSTKLNSIGNITAFLSKSLLSC